jgi:hypothetical protein
MYCANRKCPDFESSGIHGEYRDGISECPYCGQALVAENPAETPSPPEPPSDADPSHAGSGPLRTEADHSDLEPVFESSDPTEIPIVRSFLDAHGIPHVVVGEERFDAFRGVLSPFRFNPRAGMVAFLVPSAYAEETRALLVELDDGAAPDRP